jgi:hypothetical protein
VFADHTLQCEGTLNHIGESLRASTERLSSRGFQTRIVPDQDGSETKLLVRRDGIEIKIEVNLIETPELLSLPIWCCASRNC